MIKKLFLPLILILSVVLLVSCNGQETSVMPTTTDVQTTEDITTETPTSTETPTTTIERVELPDLSGMYMEDIETLLSQTNLNYTFEYITNKTEEEGLFVSYGDHYSAGDQVLISEPIEVFVYSHDIYLPDFAGMEQVDILNYFFAVGITNFQFDVVNSNEVEDQTFAGYQDRDIGDLVSADETIIVLIAFNDEQIPNLDGMVKRQITDTLSELEINFEFTYVTNNDYPEDSFAYYGNVNVGDYYDDENLLVEVVLYQNSFTSAETSLIISKYMDGEIQSGTVTYDNSGIELYNPTDQTIFLGDYHIAIFSGGSYDLTYRVDLEDIDLEPGETYLITSTNSDPNLQRIADLRSQDLIFDGVNDTIQLRYKNNTYIDTIFQLGDRGSDFDDEIFVRRENVDAGSRTFTISQWTAFVPDYYEIIGSHPLNINDQLFLTPTQIAQLIINTFDSPLGGMNEVEYRGVADGDTAYFFPGFMEGERVRFIGNDTPETSPSVVDEPEPWGLEAKAYTQTILEYADNHNKPIYVQSDPDVGYTEGYGRHLGLIWVDLGDDVLSIDIMDSSGQVLFTEELTGVILINYLLVKNGFSADEYSSDSMLMVNNRYMHRWFDEAEKFAKDNNLGIHE